MPEDASLEMERLILEDPVWKRYMSQNVTKLLEKMQARYGDEKKFILSSRKNVLANSGVSTRGGSGRAYLEYLKIAGIVQLDDYNPTTGKEIYRVDLAALRTYCKPSP